MNNPQAVRVLLADGSRRSPACGFEFLQRQPEIQILAEAKSFAEILQMADQLRPMVVLMDIHMSDETSR
jgi:DNA-binding NarL/FixJ family response regulator